MLNKRLIKLVPRVSSRTVFSVFFQWLSLICSITVTVLICRYLNICLAQKSVGFELSIQTGAVICGCVILRAVFVKIYSEFSAETARIVKKSLRDSIFKHLCKIGVSYKNYISTAEAVQVSVEGIDQLEVYFSQYMPQLFYSIVSTLTLFLFLCFINIKTAVILLICVPIIPLSIVAVQKIAKKLLSKYWDSYTTLGDSFLENIQGLTTLKIYQSDDIKHKEMNKNAEAFRKATMRVLTMQLNSISIMDIVAYGGAAVGIIAAIFELKNENINFYSAMITVLLSAEFFLPLRQLGSFFHVAMNGSAAADKIFRILDTNPKTVPLDNENINNAEIFFNNVSFSYHDNKKVLSGIDLYIPSSGLFAVVGKSGSGKSTIAGILTGQLTGYNGSITIGGAELSAITEEKLLNTITLTTHNSHIFKGTVKYNLLIGNENADDLQMQKALEKVRLWDFLKSENGLNTEISEQGSNLSGGQRQRLAIARSLLHDTPIYIFDEASSNIDVESENAINAVISELSETRLVIVISHRLTSCANADRIFVLNDSRLAEHGTHSELMENKAFYAELFTSQLELEKYAFGGDRNE